MDWAVVGDAVMFVGLVLIAMAILLPQPPGEDRAVFDAVFERLRRLLRPHRLPVLAVIDGGTRVVEFGRPGGYHAAVDLTDLARELARRGLSGDAFAADLARRVLAEARGESP